MAILRTTLSISPDIKFPIPAEGTQGTTVLTLNLAARAGVIADMTVIFDDLSHTFPDDLDMLLVAPNGINNLLFWSDAGDTNDMVDIDVQISDSVASALSDIGAIATGSYRPTNYGADETDADFGSSPAASTVRHRAAGQRFFRRSTASHRMALGACTSKTMIPPPRALSEAGPCPS